MSIYIQKLAAERRIYYDEFEAVLLLIACLYDLKVKIDNCNQNEAMEVNYAVSDMNKQHISRSDTEIMPAFFPLSIIPVALHDVGGDVGPLDFGVRLYTSSYFV